MEKMRSMLIGSKAPGYLWSEAVNTANYLVNRGPTRANQGVTPEERYSGKIPKVDHLRTWGCVAYVHVPKSDRNKLDSKTMAGRFVGYDDQTKAFRLYLPDKKKVALSKDVTFDEENFDLKQTVSTEHSNHLSILDFTMPSTASIDVTPINQDIQIQANDQAQSFPKGTTLEDLPCSGAALEGFSPAVREVRIEPPTDPLLEPSTDPSPVAPPSSSQPRRYPSRHRQPSSRLRDYYVNYLAGTTDGDPLSYNQAISDLEWAEAIHQEKQSILKMHTWEYVPLPPGRSAISAKWLFKTKQEGSGQKLKRKARMVVRGNKQEEGIDYFATYAPVVRWETIRAVLATAAQRQWEVYHLDVKTAFLNGHIQETIYMSIPQGFKTAENTGLVCLLKRALYGLKQAPRSWYSRIDNTLL